MFCNKRLDQPHCNLFLNSIQNSRLFVNHDEEEDEDEVGGIREIGGVERVRVYISVRFLQYRPNSVLSSLSSLQCFHYLGRSCSREQYKNAHVLGKLTCLSNRSWPRKGWMMTRWNTTATSLTFLNSLTHGGAFCRRDEAWRSPSGMRRRPTIKE